MIEDLIIWEWRGFWENGVDSFELLPKLYRDTLLSSRQRLEDDLYLAPAHDGHSIIKIRNGTLEIKPYVKERNYVRAFKAKKTFQFPIHAHDVWDYFAEHPAQEKIILDTDQLGEFFNLSTIQVTKYRKKIVLENSVGVEHCRLEVLDQKLSTICIEGLVFDDVLTEVNTLRETCTYEADYAGLVKLLT